MDIRSRITRSILLSLAILLLLSCQFASQVVEDITTSASQTPSEPTVVFTLVDEANAPTSTSTGVTASSETPVATLTDTPTSLPTVTQAATLLPSPSLSPSLSPTVAFTLGTPLPTQTLFPTITPFRTATPTYSGPLIINLNGYWEGTRVLYAKCGGCDGKLAHSLRWNITHTESNIYVNTGLSGYISGVVVTLDGTEKWITNLGWLKLNYILTLQPDGDTLTGRLWGEGRLPSLCVDEVKYSNCQIYNGSLTLNR